MAKEDILEFPGTITGFAPNAMFRVTYDSEHGILAGDRDNVETAPYDPTTGRITFQIQ